jgi:hypothetical protein
MAILFGLLCEFHQMGTVTRYFRGGSGYHGKSKVRGKGAERLPAVPGQVDIQYVPFFDSLSRQIQGQGSGAPAVAVWIRSLLT